MFDKMKMYEMNEFYIKTEENGNYMFEKVYPQNMIILGHSLDAVYNILHGLELERKLDILLTLEKIDNNLYRNDKMVKLLKERKKWEEKH